MYLTLHLLLRQVSIPAIFTFSIAQSTMDMYKAGAWQLALILVIFSVIWPYTKMFYMIYLWVAPTTIVSPEKRGSSFSWLDALGKWSMIDIFITVLSLVTFRITATNPQLSAELSTLLPDEIYNVEVYVTMQWGLYANLIAQVLSQLVSHCAVYYHHKTVNGHHEYLQRIVTGKPYKDPELHSSALVETRVCQHILNSRGGSRWRVRGVTAEGARTDARPTRPACASHLPCLCVLLSARLCVPPARLCVLPSSRL